MFVTDFSSDFVLICFAIVQKLILNFVANVEKKVLVKHKMQINKFGYYWLDTWVLANVIQLFYH